MIECKGQIMYINGVLVNAPDEWNTKANMFADELLDSSRMRRNEQRTFTRDELKKIISFAYLKGIEWHRDLCNEEIPSNNRRW